MFSIGKVCQLFRNSSKGVTAAPSRQPAAAQFKSFGLIVIS